MLIYIFINIIFIIEEESQLPLWYIQISWCLSTVNCNFITCENSSKYYFIYRFLKWRTRASDGRRIWSTWICTKYGL